jgi:hypothetical protein
MKFQFMKTAVQKAKEQLAKDNTAILNALRVALKQAEEGVDKLLKQAGAELEKDGENALKDEAKKQAISKALASVASSVATSVATGIKGSTQTITITPEQTASAADALTKTLDSIEINFGKKLEQ